MSIPASERFYPARDEKGVIEKGVIGRFDFMEIEFTRPTRDGDPYPEVTMKKVPALFCKTTMSPDFVPEKLPLDPLARQRMIRRFPEAWAAFQGEYVEDVGTTLDREFHGMTMPFAERQRYEMTGITAWEQIGDLSDLGCDQLGFGTRARRDNVMRALGRTPPGEVPAYNLQYGANARDVLLQQPNGAQTVAEIEARAQATANSPDMINHPIVQAAIQAAVQAALAEQKPAEPKRKGWPKGKSRKARIDLDPASTFYKSDPVTYPADVEPA